MSKKKQVDDGTNKKKKYTAEYWASQITIGLELRRKFFEKAKESTAVYNVSHTYGASDDIERRLNCWWYIVNTLLPAYYSSTPKVQCELRKKAGFLPHQLSAITLERNIQYALDEHFDFDAVAMGAASQFLLTGQAVLWPRYEVELDEEGEEKRSERAILDLVQYNDYLTSDARDEAEIEWVARRAFLSKEDAHELFDELDSGFADSLDYNSYPEVLKSREQKRDSTTYEGKSELWEIHSKPLGKVIWIQKTSSKKRMLVDDPQIDYEDFFPSVVIAATCDPDSVIPVSDFVHVRDQIIEVERLTSRIAAMTIAVRANVGYDKALGEQVEELFKGDLKVLPLDRPPGYETGNTLSKAIEPLNVELYVNTLKVLVEMRQAALQQIYESMRASDLLRGQSDATKTATANRLESQWSSMGLVVRQNMFAKFISKGIDKLGTIIASHFDMATIFDVAEVPELVGEAIDPQAQDAQQQAAMLEQQIAGILQNDTERCYRISVASDSLVALDQAQEQADGIATLQSIGTFFSQLQGIVEKYPPMMQFGGDVLKLIMRRLKMGKDFEPIFTSGWEKMGPLIEAQTAQAAQKPPTPGEAQAQARLQVAQIESQDAHQKNILEIQSMLQKQQQAAAEFQLKQQQAQRDIELRMHELDIKNEAVQAQFAAIQQKADSASATITLEAGIAQLRAILESHALKIDEHNSKVSEFTAVHNAVVQQHGVTHDAKSHALAAQGQAQSHQIATQQADTSTFTAASQHSLAERMPSTKPGK
jgi:hypothetical protein